MISSDDEYRALQADKRRERRREMREKKLNAKADALKHEFSLHLTDEVHIAVASGIAKVINEMLTTVRDMQAQIDEDFRFKQYLIQRLEGRFPTTIVFDDLMSKIVIEHLDKILSHDGEQHS